MILPPEISVLPFRVERNGQISPTFANQANRSIRVDLVDSGVLPDSDRSYFTFPELWARVVRCSRVPSLHQFLGSPEKCHFGRHTSHIERRHDDFHRCNTQRLADGPALVIDRMVNALGVLRDHIYPIAILIGYLCGAESAAADMHFGRMYAGYRRSRILLVGA